MRRAVVGVLLIAHVALTLRAYPLAFAREGFGGYRGDMWRYFPEVAGIGRTPRTFNYDPSFMAGYPVGLWNGMGKKGYELFHRLLPSVPLPQLLYGTTGGVAALAPLLAWWAFRREFGGMNGSAIWLAVLVVFWHFGTDIGYFWRFGNVFFPATALLLLTATALMNGVWTGRSPWTSATLLGVCVAAIFYFHTVLLIAALPTLAVYLVLQRARWSEARRWLALAMAAGICLVLTAWWLVPLLQNPGDCVAQPKAWFQSGIKNLIMDVFSDRGYQRPFDRNFLYHVAVVLGVAGAWIGWRERRLTLVACGGGGVLVLALTYAGSFVPGLGAVQPYRFTIPATLLLLPLVALCLARAAAVFRSSNPPVKRLLGLLLVLLMPELTAYLIDATYPAPRTGLSGDETEMAREIKNRSMRGRLLCDHGVHALACVIPYLCGVPVVGGVSDQAFLRHRFVGTDEDGSVFGRTADRWSVDDLRAYLTTYAVEYAVFSRGEWHAFAARADSPFTLERTVGSMGLYRVKDAEPTLVLEGEADVEAGLGIIRVRNTRSRRLVLKLHYAPWLRAGQGVRIEAVPVLDDPVPMIGLIVPEGVTAFVVSPGGIGRKEGA